MDISIRMVMQDIMTWENVTAANNTIAGYTLRQNTRLKRRDDLAEQLRELNGKLDGIKAKTRVFRAMERDFENYQKSVRMVMQEAQRGTLRNVHGPVSRLIRTEDEYTVAVEIALGGAMQQIVVGSEADGKAAISYLKRVGGGRATFLPMSVIKGRTLQESGLEACRGFVGIASELVTCQSQYRGIVDNLLGRIVIVSDIDAAIAMAKKYSNRFKIVTLDGQVMNPGGSMTGGSTNKEAGILSRANELEKLTAQEKDLEQKKLILETDLREAQRLTDQVEFQLSAARAAARTAQRVRLSTLGIRNSTPWIISPNRAKRVKCRAETRKMVLRLPFASEKLKPTLKSIRALMGWDRNPVVSVMMPRIPRLSIHFPAPLILRARPRRLISSSGDVKTFFTRSAGLGFSPASADRRAMTGMAVTDWVRSRIPMR